MSRQWTGAALVLLTLQGASPLATRAQAPAAGRVELRTVEDSIYHRSRRIRVYTPAGYDPARAAYPLLLVFDGEEYLDAIPLPRMLDTLIATGRIPPSVAVLVDDSSFAVRLQDLANRRPFARFVSGQLVPWIRRGWHVTTDPRHTVVAGSSAGGLGAAFVAFTHPELFGNVLSQSGAFWRGDDASNAPPYEWLTSQVAAVPRKPVRWHLEVGSLETNGAIGGAAPSLLAANRRLRDVLRRHGYEVAYLEVAGGAHRPEDWAKRLPSALIEVTRGWLAPSP